MTAFVNEKKQPPILIVAFFTEMWERYGFYIVQGLLVLYMTHRYHFSDAHSYNVLGAFTAIAYITTLIGGAIANRVIGFKHASILGALLLSLGYFMLAVPSPVAFYLGLGCIAMGNGFFKPSVSCYLGLFYREHDVRRDQGFSIFYSGINLGSMISFATSGYIINAVGWRFTFMTAGVGLILGALTFVLGIRYLKKRNQFHLIGNDIASAYTQTKLIATYIGTFIGIVVISFIIQYETLANIILILSVIALVYVIGRALLLSEKKDRHHLVVCVILSAFAVLFWALYFQLFFSIVLFIDRVVTHQVFGFNAPTPVFYAVESFGVVILGFLLGLLWKQLDLKKRDPSHPMKFALSFFVLTISFILLVICAHTTSPHYGANPYWIVIAMLAFSVGEVLLSPIGLSSITMLAPQRLVGMMMGVWLLTIGLGSKVAGLFAQISDVPKGVKSYDAVQAIYTHGFYIFIAISLVCGIIMLLLTPWTKRLIASGHVLKAE